MMVMGQVANVLAKLAWRRAEHSPSSSLTCQHCDACTVQGVKAAGAQWRGMSPEQKAQHAP